MHLFCAKFSGVSQCPIRSTSRAGVATHSNIISCPPIAMESFSTVAQPVIPMAQDPGLDSPSLSYSKRQSPAVTRASSEIKKRKRKTSGFDNRQDLFEKMDELDMSPYDVLWHMHKRDGGLANTPGRKPWREFLKKLHKPGDPLMTEILEGRRSDEASTEDRRRDRIRALDRLGWGAEELDQELNKVIALSLFSPGDRSEIARLFDQILQS